MYIDKLIEKLEEIKKEFVFDEVKILVSSSEVNDIVVLEDIEGVSFCCSDDCVVLIPKSL